MANKRKTTTAIVAGVTAAALVLGGTFAWTSISQQARNEAIVDINPGGRLHDDFNGTNKDVYVENFSSGATGVDIFARIRLDQYFEVGQDAGINKDAAERKAEVKLGGNINDVSTWETYKPLDADSNYITIGSEISANTNWNWQLGNDETNMPIYLPTFNMNKDSLAADINGTYEGTVEDDIVHYDDYKTYTDGDVYTGTEIHDWDEDTDEENEELNNWDNGGITTDDTLPIDSADVLHKENQEHIAKPISTTATVITMEEWINNGMTLGDYWVYDQDGWAYWANPIAPGETTGLLLDGIQMSRVPDDNWYYGINVVGEFATASDIYEFAAMSDDAVSLVEKLTTKVEETPETPTYTNELVLWHDNGESDVVSGGEWLIFDAEVYDENSEYIAGTSDVAFTLTDQDGNVLTQSEVAAASTTSGFTSTYMMENNLFVADDIQDKAITGLIVTATYSTGEKTYVKEYELTVEGNENPLSISLSVNNVEYSHLPGTQVYQVVTSTLNKDSYAFSASLSGGTADNVVWSIEPADEARGYTVKDVTVDDQTYCVAYANNQWTDATTQGIWVDVAEGTEVARINKTTGEFKITLDQDSYPNSISYNITATCEDDAYTKTDTLYISYRPVMFGIENAEATSIADSHMASFTKGTQSTVVVKPTLSINGEPQEDLSEAISMDLYYGQYDDPGVEEPQVEGYTKETLADGTVKFIFTIPEDRDADYIHVSATYTGAPSVISETGSYSATLPIKSTDLVSEGIASVTITDDSGSEEGQYTPGEYMKINLGAQAYGDLGSAIYSATYNWGLSVGETSSDLVKLKFTEGASSAQLWILGLTEGEITVTVTCSESGSSEDAASDTYTLTPYAETTE